VSPRNPLTDASRSCDSSCMRTTLNLDRELVEEAMRATGATTKTAAVHLGLEALVRAAAQRRLAALRGSVPEAEAPPRRRLPAQSR
jgi:Arc/MetJ family transcription regulator